MPEKPQESVGIFTENATPEIAQKFLLSAFDHALRAARVIMGMSEGKKRISIAGNILAVPSTDTADAYTFVQTLKRFVSLASGQKTLRRDIISTTSVEKNCELFAVLYRAALLDPQEWAGLVEEVREHAGERETNAP